MGDVKWVGAPPRWLEVLEVVEEADEAACGLVLPAAGRRLLLVVAFAAVELEACIKKRSSCGTAVVSMHVFCARRSPSRSFNKTTSAR